MSGTETPFRTIAAEEDAARVELSCPFCIPVSYLEKGKAIISIV